MQDEEEEAEEEETEDRHEIPDPKLPSPDVIAAHSIDHTPWRNWCRWCVEGRGVGEQHRQSHGQHNVPGVGMDYVYLTSNGLEVVEQMGFSCDQSGVETLGAIVEKGVAAKCLIVKDQQSKCVFGHVVPRKGVDAKGCAVAV